MIGIGPVKLMLAAMLATGAGALMTLDANAQSDETFETGITGVASPTPEMWFYLQELRRQQDPTEAVRRKAEKRAQQRRNRLTAMKWFGFSNLRPQASPSPFQGTYSPVWTSNSRDPYRWAGQSTPLFLEAIMRSE